MNGHAEEDVSASCEHVFDQFVTAVTCKAILTSFNNLLDLTGLRHANHANFYERLKAKLKGSWKAQNLWAKLDKRASNRDYKKGQACSNLSVLIIGAGPCGLRTAIECALLGAKTVIVEKRDRFSRNNVLHLWPFLITDLRNLGAKKFFGKFCAGAIDHISIRQLQCILLKVALLLGVEVHVNVTFDGLIEPPADESLGVGWKCKVIPENHAVSEYQFDALIGADGKRNTLSGFKRKEFRGKLAIAITANFINRNSQAEARVQEISGVAFIFNQKFFTDLKDSTRIDLENIVYYKDDTHYFVMTAKKASLLEKGVLKEDYSDTLALLDRANVDQERLMAFAREAANFSTNYQLPSLDYAVNHYGQADVAMFDFTSMFAAENASRFILKNGHHLLMGLVGDSLLEPFWPTGSGCARGFLSAFDIAWMLRSWAMGKKPLQVLAERESIYTILSQTTPNYLNKNHNLFSIDPNTRYPNLNMKVVKPSQVRHLYDGGVFDSKELEEEDLAMTVPAKRSRNAEISGIDSYSLLRWCQRVLNTGKYRDVHVVDFTSSWRSGLALCALIHSFRPDIINNTILMECDVALNNQLAFNIAEKELGILPVLTGDDMAKYEVPDKLTMVSYLAQFYDLFKHEPLPSTMPLPVKAKRKSLSKDVSQPKAPHSPTKRTSLFQKLSAKLAKSKKRKEQEENERSILGNKKMKEKEDKNTVELTRYSKLPMEEIANRFQLDRKTDIKVNKTEERSGAVSVTAMADLLVAKFKNNESKPPPEPIRKLRGQPTLLAATPASEFCSFCHKRVYIMERMSAEGEFFHRGCLKCDYCSVGLRLNNYSCDRDCKPVKFFCYRHAIPEQRSRPQRKRGLDEAVTESVPELVVTPAPDVDTGQAPKEKTPRKAASLNLTPVMLPKDFIDKPENTPERIEFEISFDGQEEESEEEQFEHNLRASQSSETLLDDDDSDLDLSDSDIESGAEDEIWENAVESFKTPRTPLTLIEACELQGNWRRQHSHENLADTGEDDGASSRRKEYSRLFGENGEEEESSTEVEEDSEYETDDSSSEDSEEDKTEPAQGISAEDHAEMSLNSSSPVSKISASKASFFSEPPKVVSLDPWSMFGMGQKTAEKEAADNVVKQVKVTRKKSSSSDKKKFSTSGSRSASERKKSTDSRKDTDVSIESLELDAKSADLVAGKDENMSPAGSLDELREELVLDVMEDEQHRQNTDNVETVERLEEDEQQHDINNRSDESLEGNDLKEKEKGIEGDDELKKIEEELVEKTSLDHAFEELLQSVDNKNIPKTISPDKLLTESSESDENEMSKERHLSPSSKKTRKPYIKCRTRHIKNLQKFHSANSDSEAGRTDPTSTDSSQRNSPVPHSPSLDSADDLVQCNEIDDRSQNNSVSLRNISSPTVEEYLETNINNLENTIVSHIATIDNHIAIIKAEGGGDDDDDDDYESYQKVLENAAAMSELSDNSDIDDLIFNNIDERFVTDRRKKPVKKPDSKLKREMKLKLNQCISDFSQKEKELLNKSSSVSISSESESEESFVGGEILDIEPGDDDIKPDQDMLNDYTTTLSLALGESYSDEVEEKDHVEEGSGDINLQENVNLNDEEVQPKTESINVCNSFKNEQTSITEDTETTVENSSIYITPDASLDKHNVSAAESSTPVSVLISHPLTVPGSTATVSQTINTSVESSTKAEPTSSNTQDISSALTLSQEQNNRDSTGSDIFFTPAEVTTQPTFVNNSTLNSQSPTSSLPHLSEAETPKSEQSVLKQNKITQSISAETASNSKATPNSKSPTNSLARSSQRKLPELPKLNIPQREMFHPSATDQPIMCSSPKLGSKLTIRTPTSNLQDNHALLTPTTNNTTNKNEPGTVPTNSKSTLKDSFTKPISPPAKTKVPIDKSKLKLNSLSDIHDSDHEIDAKKKISAEGIKINHTFDDDIPFADESEAEERFYTPSAQQMKGKPVFPLPSSYNGEARKKIVPNQLTIQNSDMTHVNTQKSKLERGKIQQEEQVNKLNTLYDTNSDALSDREENRRQSTTSSPAEGDQMSQQTAGKGKKSKVKTHKAKKQNDKDVKEKKSVVAQDKQKRTPLVVKSPINMESNESSTCPSSNTTPKKSYDNLKNHQGAIIKNASRIDDKLKTVIVKSESLEDFDKTPTSENKRDLAICSVFHSEVSNRPSKVLHGVPAARKALTLPKASADEMSDSDESHISLSTMQRRREEDLDDRVARRLQKIQLKQQKRAEQKRLRMAQEIQRQLEEVEVRQRELEERGIAVEKALRGDATDDDVDENQLMSEWFSLVHEKNALLRYESELIVRAKELELEDRQARLELDFRERSKQPVKTDGAEYSHHKKETKTKSDIAAEGHLLDELLDVVEQRNSLVAMLEEERLKEEKEDNDLKKVMAQKGFLLSPLSFDTRRKKMEAPLATYAL